MSKKAKMPAVNTNAPVKSGSAAQLPHERDETPDKQPVAPKKEMKRAFTDLKNGLVDTDLRGQRGVEEVVKGTVKKRK
ncbi:MAG TPA: hypothetical protein DIT28_19110 [Oxalobacteraceae bacterium]|jgi:hypothetical protein|nr:hypothetical protein [Oxalobacteraceae bacterium]HCN91254.1 hypothetical protein [Oxalobacteraceae bacterium]